jgi:AmmeMemoRadiSam system protein A
MKRIAAMTAACALALTACRAGAEVEKGASGTKPPALEQKKGSAAMNGKKADGPAKEYLSAADKATLLKLARETVESFVRTGKKTKVEVTSKVLLEKGAAFVTLKKHGELRGCIGDIIARAPLANCVVDRAVDAAVNDSRFDPVQPGELADIDIEISVLTPLEPVGTPDEIVVGKDGLLLTKGWNRGVFLPQVPVEQKWDRKQYLDHLCRKAGLNFGCWKDAKLEKFQAIVFGEKE